ncbi:aminoglycoside phosphotransferase family protein [Thiomicrospira microaerophila]|uniref:aminoglycoside phosphotransferase family protein n=1 Tax=Thiomicrospira microaerophila TaxID=406020 RepID=UPI0020108138|nr:aminoglycoside phosphotransferase family protein [Thiomicrospira microaerophila]UQB42613.1 aminoglycoside phosphotransferase family protein [Thiomicrospira microaerophila]
MTSSNEQPDALGFLILEIRKQLRLIERFLQTGELRYASSSLKRRDYIDNYHIQLVNRLQQVPAENFYSLNHMSYSLRAFSHSLDDLVFHSRQLKHFNWIQHKRVFESFSLLLDGLDSIEAALADPQLQSALKLCRSKVQLDKNTDKLREKLAKLANRNQHNEDLLQASFIIHDLSKLGEALLHIGEAIISEKIGQPIEIQRYRSLEATLTQLELNTDDLSIHSLGETKSGCLISGVKNQDDDEDKIIAVFKQGDQTKLKEEKLGIQRWQKKYPGIAPKLYSYHRSGDKAALLYEYLEGDTLDSLLIKHQYTKVNQALDALFSLLPKIWQDTQIDQPVGASFMQQLKKRLPDIYQVHPEFEVSQNKIGELKQERLETLIKQGALLESKLTVPMAVYIHGDFNLDNILFDSHGQTINFIDLHRSDYLDYVQDLSVLMVSHYRLMNFDPEVRKQLALSMDRIYDFGADYAQTIQDTHFHLRLGLGLARSFLTSTRFVLDQSHAKSMHFRGRYLLENLVQLTQSQQDLLTYRIPKELFRD